MKDLFGSAALPSRWARARVARATSQTVFSDRAHGDAPRGARRAGARASYSRSLLALSTVALALALPATERAGFAAVPGAPAAASRVASDVATDWPGCGGVCGVRIETDYLVLDMSSAPVPSAALRITLTLFLLEHTGESSSRSFDVSSAFHAGQSGVVSVSSAAIPGGMCNVTSAVLSWVDPETGVEGKEALPLY